jgi:hypothetical protein
MNIKTLTADGPLPAASFSLLSSEAAHRQCCLASGCSPMLSHFKSLNINWSGIEIGGCLVLKSANSSVIGVFEIA